MRVGERAVAALLFAAGTIAAPGRAQQKVEVGDGASAGAGTVTVSAAASLTSAFRAVAGAFERRHPDVSVRLNFAGSPTLVQQIRQGAPVDVFASADETSMQKLVDSGEVAAEPRLFARNELRIVVARGNPRRITGLADLARPGLTLVLCGPTVPCGRYATEAFGKAGVVVPAASQEIDVKAVLGKVVAGEADAGIVYATDVLAAGGAVDGVVLPASADVNARYPIALVNGAPNPSAGAAFVAFVLSSRGQELLSAFGFSPPRGRR